jgi:hypothetical protein
LLQNFNKPSKEISFSFTARMKKILVVILLVTYAFASSGASVDLHYCMGKLIGWDFDYASKNDCRNCGMQTKPDKGCCDNKQINPKIDKEQQAAYNTISLNNDLVAILPDYSILNDALFTSSTIANPSIHGPPLITSGALYLFHCNFRI